MNIDPGLVIVIVAVLIFYLRLIVLQRQRAKQIAPKPAAAGKKKGKSQPQAPPVRYSIITQNRRGRVIGVAGAIAILVGILLNTGLLPFPLGQIYWWVPTSLGIVLFSWLFTL
jgi:hypothetical protein